MKKFVFLFFFRYFSRCIPRPICRELSLAVLVNNRKDFNMANNNQAPAKKCSNTCGTLSNNTRNTKPITQRSVIRNAMPAGKASNA